MRGNPTLPENPCVNEPIEAWRSSLFFGRGDQKKKKRKRKRWRDKGWLKYGYFIRPENTTTWKVYSKVKKKNNKRVCCISLFHYFIGTDTGKGRISMGQGQETGELRGFVDLSVISFFSWHRIKHNAALHYCSYQVLLVCEHKKIPPSFTLPFIFRWTGPSGFQVYRVFKEILFTSAYSPRCIVNKVN